MASYAPGEYTDGITTVVVSTTGEAADLIWQGWWRVGDVEPPIPLHERFAFGPTPPVAPRRGVVYIPTPQ